MNSYAGIFKWVDKDGNIHYGDTPDKNIKTQEIQIEPIDSSKYKEGIELQKRLLKQAEEKGCRYLVIDFEHPCPKSTRLRDSY